jgi:hypothetical protein
VTEYLLEINWKFLLSPHDVSKMTPFCNPLQEPQHVDAHVTTSSSSTTTSSTKLFPPTKTKVSKTSFPSHLHLRIGGPCVFGDGRGSDHDHDHRNFEFSKWSWSKMTMTTIPFYQQIFMVKWWKLTDISTISTNFHNYHNKKIWNWKDCYDQIWTNHFDHENLVLMMEMNCLMINFDS